ncbi:TIGR04348 family glycosyltransferase [bacterium]|nr:TIGR04348 family glycosyltransferase [bacterium]
MRIRFLVPLTDAGRNGNIVTSERWKSFMEELGHQVAVDHESCREACDLLVAFHAYRSRSAIFEAKRSGMAGKMIICFTGTDLYRDLKADPQAADVLHLADRLVVLQPAGLDEVPASVRDRTSVIYQSAVRPASQASPSPDSFDICVIAHLRDVKDPLRAARAARLLPSESKIRVLLVGRALTDGLARAAEEETKENGRFRWLGELSAESTAKVLMQSRLLVLSSLMEGGANVVSEAIVLDVPVIVTEIPCMKGLLGADYPGFFPVMDTDRLAELMLRAEMDQTFYEGLRQRCRQEAYKFSPSLERERIRELLATVQSGQ